MLISLLTSILYVTILDMEIKYQKFPLKIITCGWINEINIGILYIST